MTFADKLFNHLAAARMENGGKLPEPKWKSEVMAFVDRERPAKKKAKVNALGAGLTDVEWLADLAKDPDLAGVDLVDQARRCRLHFKGKQITPSRARLLRWFARCDRTIPENRNGSATDCNSVYKEPASEWRGIASNFIDPDSHMAERIRDGLDWVDVPLHLREKIVRSL